MTTPLREDRLRCACMPERAVPQMYVCLWKLVWRCRYAVLVFGPSGGEGGSVGQAFRFFGRPCTTTQVFGDTL